MAEKPKEPKRLNRVAGVAEALTGALDPALKRRGFATRDIVTHWGAMAPDPYDKVALPDKLTWPRGEKSAEGATLYLRCMRGHALALSHEGARVAAAVNRYFGYVLVREVRLSAEPFTPHSAASKQTSHEPSEASRKQVGALVADIEDEGLREALRQLGLGVMSKGKNTRSSE